MCFTISNLLLSAFIAIAGASSSDAVHSANKKMTNIFLEEESMIIENENQHVPKHRNLRSSVTRYLCIYSNEAEDETDCDWDEGHAALMYAYKNGDGPLRGTFYGLWPDDHPAIIRAGLNNGDGSDVRTNFSLDRWSSSAYPFRYCEKITSTQRDTLREWTSKNIEWGYWDNCSWFASKVFRKVTGTDVDANDWILGFSTPCELGKNINILNGD